MKGLPDDILAISFLGDGCHLVLRRFNSSCGHPDFETAFTHDFLHFAHPLNFGTLEPAAADFRQRSRDRCEPQDAA